MRIKLNLIITAYASLALSSPFAQACSLVDAVWWKESSHRTSPGLGDHGLARGPLQCHRNCWVDSKIAGKYSDVDDIAYATRVFNAYTDRWAGESASDHDRALAWHWGPSWRTKPEDYWLAVKKFKETK